MTEQNTSFKLAGTIVFRLKFLFYLKGFQPLSTSWSLQKSQRLTEGKAAPADISDAGNECGSVNIVRLFIGQSKLVLAGCRELTNTSHTAADIISCCSRRLQHFFNLITGRSLTSSSDDDGCSCFWFICGVRAETF